MLRSEVKMTYAELAAVRRQAEVVRRTRDVLRAIVGVTQELYSAGRGSPRPGGLLHPRGPVG